MAISYRFRVNRRYTGDVEPPDDILRGEIAYNEPGTVLYMGHGAGTGDEASEGRAILYSDGARLWHAAMGKADGTTTFKGDGSALTALSWGSIDSTPTTISGYGITDAVTLAGDQTITGAKTFSNSIEVKDFTIGKVGILSSYGVCDVVVRASVYDYVTHYVDLDIVSAWEIRTHNSGASFSSPLYVDATGVTAPKFFGDGSALTGLTVAQVSGGAPLASPVFTGNPTAPTPVTADNDTTIATTAHVHAVVTQLMGAAPAALDTLVEIAAALNDDPDFAATMTSALSGKAATTRTITAGTGLSGGGNLTADRTINLANTAVTPGSYGSGTAIPSVTVDAQGRVTSASSAAVAQAAKLTTPRQLTIGNTGKNFDGSAAVSWSLADIGISSGSNANGNWLKIGPILVCWANIALGSIKAFGSGTDASPYRTATYDWTFPEEFDDADYVIVPGVYRDDSGLSGTRNAYTANRGRNPTTTGVDDLQAHRIGSDSNDDDVILSVIALGLAAT